MNDYRPLLPRGDELRKKTAPKRPWLWAAAPVISALVLIMCMLIFRTGAPASDAKEAVSEPVYTFRDIAVKDAGAVISAEISSRGSGYTLSKNGENWLIDGEGGWPVSERAKSVLASGASVMSRMELEGSYADFGLDEPQAQARYTYENGQQMTISIGSQVAGGNGYYACVSTSDRIYVVGEAVRSVLTMPREKLYGVPKISDRFTAADIMALTLSVNGRDEITIRRLDGSNPHNSVAEFTQPVHYPCNATRTGELFLAVAALQPVSVISLDGGTESIEFLAHISAENENGITGFTIGKKDGSAVMLMDESDTVYLLEDGALDFLERSSVAWLAEQTPGLVMLTRVYTLTVSFGEEKHVLEPSGDTYFVDGTDIGRSDFVALYKQLIGFLIERYEPAAVWDGANEVIRLEYLLDDGTVFTLAFASFDENYYLILRDDDAHFLISRSRVDAVMDAVRTAGKGKV